MDASCVTTRKEKQNQTEQDLWWEGDRINYPTDCSTPTANLLMIKLLLNSVISTPQANFLIMDIKNLYPSSPLKKYEYLQFKMDDIENVKQHYKFGEKAMQDGLV